jgi:hypothetical protein
MGEPELNEFPLLGDFCRPDRKPMLRSMSTAKPPHFSRSPAALCAGSILFDRASLEGLECLDSGWDEWDNCVAEQDLRNAILEELRVRQAH